MTDPTPESELGVILWSARNRKPRTCRLQVLTGKYFATIVAVCLVGSVISKVVGESTLRRNANSQDPSLRRSKRFFIDAWSFELEPQSSGIRKDGFYTLRVRRNYGFIKIDAFATYLLKPTMGFDKILKQYRSRIGSKVVFHIDPVKNRAGIARVRFHYRLNRIDEAPIVMVIDLLKSGRNLLEFDHRGGEKPDLEAAVERIIGSVRISSPKLSR